MPLSKDRNIIVPQEELDRQMEFCGLVHTVLETRLDGRKPLAYVHTFGCQGNVADSERLKGLLEKMGFGFTEEPENADISLCGQEWQHQPMLLFYLKNGMAIIIM